MTTSPLQVKLFVDCADQQAIFAWHQHPAIKGFTTNPSLMRKAGVRDYKTFALNLLRAIKDKPISFEVFADDFKAMKTQALEIASWGENVYVKIPVMNTKAHSSIPLIRELALCGVKQNITALMTLDQVKIVTEALANGPAAFISVFAGRIADTGRDPMPLIGEAVKVMQHAPQLELIWASSRELLNVFQANNVGCHIITVPEDILKKLSHVNKDLLTFSLETVKMFHEDATIAGFSLDVT